MYFVQCANALQRLEASFVKEAHLEIARGGSAEFTDLMRVLVSLYLFITGKFGQLPDGEEDDFLSIVGEQHLSFYHKVICPLICTCFVLVFHSCRISACSLPTLHDVEAETSQESRYQSQVEES